MTLEFWMALGGLIISGLVAIAGIVKGRAEGKKVQGDTFSIYQEALTKAQENYDKLAARLDAVEKKYNDTIIHNGALIRQLVDNRILPISLQQAIKERTEELR